MEMKEARRKSLASLEGLQQRQADETRMTLARSLAEERQVNERIAGLKARMLQNRLLVTAAREEGAHDLTLWNGYRYWLPVAQEELEQQQGRLAELAEQSERIRQTMRSQLREREVTSTMLEKDRQAQARHHVRQEQAALDDQAGSRYRAGDGIGSGAGNEPGNGERDGLGEAQW